MIRITEKKDCCGCSACVQVCPKQCISLAEDKEGFLYPNVDTSVCIECGLCEKTCPILHPDVRRLPIHVYASINPDEKIRLQSSSGGLFTLLAKEIIQEGGVVFGAKFDDNWEVRHDYTETMEGLAAFRGSKYIQSRIEDNFRKAETFLKEGRKVLFTGTPCQIAGLKRFLRKEYDNLLTVDILCHGVPSPGVWRKYLKETTSKAYNEIKQINFRDKRTGWKNYRFTITYTSRNTYSEAFSQNPFMKGFLTDLYLRPSCYQCPAKAGKSGSDITIADFWAITQVCPEMDDDKGTNLTLINTEKGKVIYSKLSIADKETGYEESRGRNGGFKENVSIPQKRTYFFSKLNKKKSVSHHIQSILSPSPWQQWILRIKQKIR